MRADVSFDSAGIQIAGHLYTPDDDTPDDSHIGPRPAIVVGHPGSGVKEQRRPVREAPVRAGLRNPGLRRRLPGRKRRHGAA